jgi:hypothetical protein
MKHPIKNRNTISIATCCLISVSKILTKQNYGTKPVAKKGNYECNPEGAPAE